MTTRRGFLASLAGAFTGAAGGALALRAADPPAQLPDPPPDAPVVRPTPDLVDDLLQHVHGDHRHLLVSLHTGRVPTEDNECSYRGYRRVSVQRNALNWEVDGCTVSNARDIVFPECVEFDDRYQVARSILVQGGEGIPLFAQELDVELVLSRGDTPCFRRGDLAIDAESRGSAGVVMDLLAPAGVIYE